MLAIQNIVLGQLALQIHNLVNLIIHNYNLYIHQLQLYTVFIPSIIVSFYD